MHPHFVNARRLRTTLVATLLAACAPDPVRSPQPSASSSQAPLALPDAAPETTAVADTSADALAVALPYADADAPADASAPAEAVAPADAPPASPSSACNTQDPQEFLIRKTWYFNPKLKKDEQKRRSELHTEAIRYRTEHYGYFPGFGKPEWNAHSPSYYAENTKFFGLVVKMNKSVIPVLHCVEEEIRATCGATPYKPVAVGGIRTKNTYRGGEASNHLYGIAIDIDPALNPCCGCVPPWNNAPQCHRPSKSPFDRMKMPECWVHAFTKYGFYWLGYDPMNDTMHFEFFGDPDKIVKK